MSEALRIAVMGLNDAATRVANVSKNLVNVLSTGRLPETSGGQATSYQPTDVVTVSNSVGDNALGVRSIVVERDPAYRVAPDPESPNANEDGLIAVPNVDVAAELICMKIAEMTYRANAALIRTAQEMDRTALDIET